VYPKLQIEGFLLPMYGARLRLANQIYVEVERHFQYLVFGTSKTEQLAKNYYETLKGMIHRS
ncbi:MAG: hypothetical protein MJ078_01620, partial [Clostridia bacterium]|nr:hypothetical protein [Clostridia bacterium]